MRRPDSRAGGAVPDSSRCRDKSPADARIAAMGHPETERDWDGPQQHEENESGHGT